MEIEEQENGNSPKIAGAKLESMKTLFF